MGGGSSKDLFALTDGRFGDLKKANFRATSDSDTTCVEDRNGQFLFYCTKRTGAFGKFCLLSEAIIQAKRERKADLGLFNEGEENDANFSEYEDDSSSSSDEEESESDDSDENVESDDVDTKEGEGSGDDKEDYTRDQDEELGDLETRLGEESDIDRPVHRAPMQESRIRNQWTASVRRRGGNETNTASPLKSSESNAGDDDNNNNSNSNRSYVSANEETNDSSWLRIRNRKTFQMFILFQALGGVDAFFFQFIRKNALEAKSKPEFSVTKWEDKSGANQPIMNGRNADLSIRSACSVIYEKFDADIDESMEYLRILEEISSKAEKATTTFLEKNGITERNVDTVLNLKKLEENAKLFDDTDEGSYNLIDSATAGIEVMAEKGKELLATHAPDVIKILVPPPSGSSTTTEKPHTSTSSSSKYKDFNVPALPYTDISTSEIMAATDILRLQKRAEELKGKQMDALRSTVEKRLGLSSDVE